MKTNEPMSDQANIKTKIMGWYEEFLFTLSPMVREQKENDILGRSQPRAPLWCLLIGVIACFYGMDKTTARAEPSVPSHKTTEPQEEISDRVKSFREHKQRLKAPYIPPGHFNRAARNVPEDPKAKHHYYRNLHRQQHYYNRYLKGNRKAPWLGYDPYSDTVTIHKPAKNK